MLYASPTYELDHYLTLFGYLGIFIFFLTIDQVTPIPEEISLLTIGYFSSKGAFNPIIGGAVALFAFVAVDSFYFLLVKSGARHSAWLRKKVSSGVLKKVGD